MSPKALEVDALPVDVNTRFVPTKESNAKGESVHVAVLIASIIPHLDLLAQQVQFIKEKMPPKAEMYKSLPL